MPNPFAVAFAVLQDQAAYFQHLSDQSRYGRLMSSQILTILVFTFCYGLVMGSFHSILQAVGVTIF